MMHVRFNEQGMAIWQSAQTKLQVKWSSICNELHIDETPHFNYLIDSRLFTRQD